MNINSTTVEWKAIIVQLALGVVLVDFDKQAVKFPYGNALIQLIEGYTTSLETILEVAIQDEKISTQLREIVAQLEPMKSHIESLCKEAKSLCETYVTEIDSADQFLY